MTSMVKLQCSAVPISHDDQGILADDLEELLSTWPQKYPDRPRPKALYAITAGNNPRGYNWSEERMVDIYQLCRKYNLLILDDGAYYFVQFGQKRSRSFQSLDVDGRVIRFDTFSKIVGAGYRLGWASGPKSIIDKVTYDIQLTTIHANAYSQALKCLADLIREQKGAEQ
ncbi:kynurenine/alpha-aminoadipate aminotransferase, mitochondrial-like [Aplysia californica]|uniref:Kynurenine/alpha-aminoadipate aminotransferase, mitochondrial-like n=1 Tax=Aplysia californica TaxID=6500 RepID=A0ABM0JZM9_APLCA|nr:kynurenine/alpha-aminoadipate aminotransferase, mitochondrial-like [Aplysia californica]